MGMKVECRKCTNVVTRLNSAPAQWLDCGQCDDIFFMDSYFVGDLLKIKHQSVIQYLTK